MVAWEKRSRRYARAWGMMKSLEAWEALIGYREARRPYLVDDE
jgi:hypothetical protein